MTHKLTDKASVLEVPADNQTYTRAGEIYSTVEDVSQWNTDVNGSYIQDGKLALSVSESTAIANADTLYPDLWANSPVAWKNSTTLTIPSMGASEQVETEFTPTWISVSNMGTIDTTYPFKVTKVGRKVFVKGYVILTAIAASAATTIKFSASELPFPTATRGFLTGQVYRNSNPSPPNIGHFYELSGHVECQFETSSVANKTYYLSFSYETSIDHTLTTPLISVYSNSWPDYIGTGNGGVLGDVKQSILTIEQFNNNTANGGEWSLCDGRAIPRARYAKLYSLIGDTYGAGDGSTTFNLPNFAGRYTRGAQADQSDVGDMLDDATSAANLAIAAFNGEKGGAGTSNTTGARNINASSTSNLAFTITSANTNGNVVNGIKGSLYGSYAGNDIKLVRGNIATNVNNVPNHSHNVAVDTDINHGHNISGDTETRPSSITLNTFIRIA
jgi:microcystin-dependent protein